MKYIMYSTKLRWWHQPISSCTNRLQNYIPRTQLFLLLKYENTFTRRYFEENMIPDLKVQLLIPIVYITLLFVLCCPQSIPDQLNLICILLNNKGTFYLSGCYIIPIIGRLAMSIIKSLELCHFNGCMITVIIGKLC